MTDLLFIGASGVRAYQQALTATGDNVANADTPGFSRRLVRLEAQPGGSGGITDKAPGSGFGVRATALLRSNDALRDAAARTAAGDHARLVAESQWTERIETRLAGAELPGRIAALFDAASDVAASPTALATRRIFLAAADDMASAFRTAGSSLDALAEDIDRAVGLAATRANDLLQALARTNEELRRSQPDGPQRVALLDVRDGLMADLARTLPISVTESPNGDVGIRLGAGPAAPLLLPATGTPVQLAARLGASGPELVLNPTHAAEPARLPLSGELAGLLQARATLARLAADLDELATRIADELNLWHQSGADLQGQPGEPLFRQLGFAARPGPANTGTASLGVTLADVNTADPTGYRLIAGNGDFTLERGDGTASVTGPGPLLLDGLRLDIAPGARPGDSWTLSPVTGARGLTARPLAPGQLAAARPFLVTPAATNSPARLTATPDPTAAAFTGPPPLRIEITAPGTLTITDPLTDTLLATLPFTPGVPVEADGLSFTLEGTASVGDIFRIDPPRPGSADNGHLLTLADVRARQSPLGTIESRLDTLTTRLATGLAQTRRLETAAAAIAEDAQRFAAAASAVDLDREAAELTRLQMAYRANAQLIATARTLFDTILGTTA